MIEVYKLEDDYKNRVKIEYLPLEFFIESAFGLPGKRDAYYLNKLSYSYQDVRRIANDRNPK